MPYSGTTALMQLRHLQKQLLFKKQLKEQRQILKTLPLVDTAVDDASQQLATLIDVFKFPTCDGCREILGSKAALENHRRTVHGVQYECDVFQEKFGSKTQVADHRRTQHGQYQCDMSGKIWIQDRFEKPQKNSTWSPI